MTASIRRTAIPDASFGAVDRAMRLLGLEGVRRTKGVWTRDAGADGRRAGDRRTGTSREVRRLREDNAILKAAATFFASIPSEEAR